MRTSHLLVTGLVALAALGCAPQGPYRPDTTATGKFVADPQLCPELKSPSTHEITVAYVEIDEQGYFQDRGQVERAPELVAATGKPKYVVVFVHGWFHNAALTDKNVERFKCALNNLPLPRSQWVTMGEIHPLTRRSGQAWATRLRVSRHVGGSLARREGPD